ncbi:hypothetical protein AgCh_018894 [Apium graveolens]
MAVCMAVGFLGLLATALSFAAETKRIKRSQILYTSSSECTHPRSPALALGLMAVVALVKAQIIINVATGCLCYRRGPNQSNCSWTVALFCSVVSWFTFVTAVILLLFGAALNDETGEESKYQGHYVCYVLGPGVFTAAAILSLATVVLGILSFVMVQSAKNRGDSWIQPAPAVQPGIAIGQPQFPQQRYQDPVFV